MEQQYGITMPTVDRVVVLQPPQLFFTVEDSGTQNPRSRAVLEKMEALAHLQDQYADKGLTFQVFSGREAGESDLKNAVAVFDGNPRNQFSYISDGVDKDPAPFWAKDTRWRVNIGQKCANAPTGMDSCAQQTLAIYIRRFRSQIEADQYPWGPPKKGKEGPRDLVTLDQSRMMQLVANLNEGPDLAASIASRTFAKELPQGSRISWIRVPPGTIGIQEAAVREVADAIKAFEEVSGVLLLSDENVRKTILSGVVIPDPRLYDVYVDPGVKCFSVRRPDKHVLENGFFVTENDEMPGGMPELRHLDLVYGVNSERWKGFFDALCAEGPLVFVVSHRWSGCYVPETKWLVEHLRREGYDAELVTTDQIDGISIGESGVSLNGKRIGTVWRQFPIFETEGKLAEIVLAARRGAVRLIPEFAHFGNKSWFDVFWQRSAWYQEHMEPSHFDVLRRVLPRSFLVSSSESFPLQFEWGTINNLQELRSAPQDVRDSLVLKVAGANDLASRSYGVLMGDGIKELDWSAWIRNRLEQKTPFLVQQRFRTAVMRLPVWNTQRTHAELFHCRMLLRPWMHGDNIISVHCCAVPKQYHKVHGMVTMAVASVELQ